MQSLFYLCQHKVTVYSVTVCCSGCQIPPGSASYFTSFCLTGRVLRILRVLDSRCQPDTLPTGTSPEPGQRGCAQTARLGAAPLAAAVISRHAAYVNGQGTASYWEGYALMCAWLYLKFKTYILIKWAVPCGRPALNRQANSFPQLR